MKAESRLASRRAARLALPSGTRLENLGFGSTLAAFAVAVLIFAASPALAENHALAQWIQSCASLVSSALPIAASTAPAPAASTAPAPAAG